MRHAIRISCVALTAAALAIASARPAEAAEPTATDKATARSMLIDGYRELEAGNGARALELFRAADALMKVPTTRLAVARAHAKLGKLVEAENTLIDLLRIPEHPDDPPPYAKARSDARALLEDVGPRVPELTLKGVPDDATVKIDDVVVPRASLVGARRLDPGRHVVLVGTARTDVTLAEREKKTIDVSSSAASSPKVAEPATVATPAAKAPEKPAEQSSPSASKEGRGPNVLMIAGFAVAGVGVVTGSITGLMAMSKKSDADEFCRGNQCPPEANNDLDSSERFATISTVAFVVGAVGLGVGIYGLLTGSSSPPSSATTTASLRFGPGGVVGRF